MKFGLTIMSAVTALSVLLVAAVMHADSDWTGFLWLPSIALAACGALLSAYWLLRRHRKQGGILLTVNLLALGYVCTPFLLA